jgi:predicted GTPase
VELKAAAVDVAARAASAAGARMVVCDNRPVVVGSTGQMQDRETLSDVVRHLADLADTRFTNSLSQRRD